MLSTKVRNTILVATVSAGLIGVGAGASMAAPVAAPQHSAVVAASTADTPLQTTLKSIIAATTVDQLKPLAAQLVKDMEYVEPSVPAAQKPAFDKALADIKTAATALNSNPDPSAVEWWHKTATTLLAQIGG